MADAKPFNDEEIKGFNEVYKEVDELSSGMTNDEIEVHRRFLATIAADRKRIEKLSNGMVERQEIVAEQAATIDQYKKALDSAMRQVSGLNKGNIADHKRIEELEKHVELNTAIKKDHRVEMKQQAATIERLRGKKNHPEDYCHHCGGRNMEWHTDNEIWNELTRGEDKEIPGIICPLCLDELDREKRKDGSHWYITKKI